MASEKTYRLKLEFYNTVRKMKNFIERIFISMTMHPNFMHFRQKISFKSALKSFASVNGHLRTFHFEIWMHDYWNKSTSNNIFHFSVSVIELKFQLIGFLGCPLFLHFYPKIDSNAYFYSVFKNISLFNRKTINAVWFSFKK